jgi:sulfite reductase alpha subunit-like flavoprotein
LRENWKESTEVPGVGFVSTSWVGKRGQDELVEIMRKQTEVIKVSELKKELKTLAVVCLQGFASTDVERAVNQYAPSVKSTEKASTAVAELWRSSLSTSCGTEDKVQHATEILGEKIVAKITEENRDTPHVSVDHHPARHAGYLPCV